MKRVPALPWALALLDDGLRLYRRNLPPFALVGSIVLVPAAVLGLLFTAFVRTQLGGGWTILGFFLLLIILYPLLLYAAGALSRAAAMALDGGPIRVGQALRIGPVRALGMGCYNFFFSVITSIISTIFGFVIGCPVLYASIFGFGFLGEFGGSGTLGAVGGLFGVVFGLVQLASWMVSGTQVASMVYAVQAFALEQRSFGATLSRSVDLLFFRLGRNLLVFLGAGTIIGTLVIAYTGTLLVGGQLLLGLLDVELSPPATAALVTAVVTASGVLLLPPLPIWMALLHRALAEERDAADLVAAVERWHAGTVHTA